VPADNEDPQARHLVLLHPSSRDVRREDDGGRGGRTPKQRRPILDCAQPGGFVAYPYYATREVAEILSVSDDYVRTLFRNGRHGRVLQICDPKPGRRRYEVLLLPYATLIAFIDRFTKDGSLEIETTRLRRRNRCA
jgi:hypothetical protein